jgi:glutamate racemase
MWVPLVETNEHEGPGADYFIEKHLRNLLSAAPSIDTLFWGVRTIHYSSQNPAPAPSRVQLLDQGGLSPVAFRITLGGTLRWSSASPVRASGTFETTDAPAIFDSHASVILQQPVSSRKVTFKE